MSKHESSKTSGTVPLSIKGRVSRKYNNLSDATEATQLTHDEGKGGVHFGGLDLGGLRNLTAACGSELLHMIDWFLHTTLSRLELSL